MPNYPLTNLSRIVTVANSKMIVGRSMSGNSEKKDTAEKIRRPYVAPVLMCETLPDTKLKNPAANEGDPTNSPNETGPAS